MKKCSLRSILKVLLVCTMLFGCCVGWAKQGDYPSRPIEIVVPAKAGGGTDLNARVLSRSLQQVTGQPVAIINVSGAAGTIAANEVLDSKADGYKGLYFHADLIINSLMGMSGYRWQDKFKIAGIVSRSFDYAMIVRGNAPYNNVEQLKKYAASSSKKPIYAMETGGIAHVLALAFQNKSGIKLNLVDIGGAADKISALLGGQVDIITMPYGNVRDYVANGDFKVIGVMGGARSPFADKIPTLKEQGIDIEHETFFFVAFPKKTPNAIVKKMSDYLKQATATAGFKKETEKLLYSVSYMNSADATAYMQAKEAGYKTYTKMALASKKGK
jgi:tripartite-type tricarboxylate transporter receptor subunit TctC